MSIASAAPGRSAPKLQPSVLVPCGPVAADAERRSSAPRIGDVTPVSAAALPPVVLIPMAPPPAQRPGFLDLAA